MWCKYPSLGSRHTRKKVQFYGDTNNSNLQTVLARQNKQCREEQVILSTIRYKSTERLPQADNDETKNLQEHACKEKWDGP